MTDRRSTKRSYISSISKPLKQPVDVVEFKLRPIGLPRPAAELIEYLACALDRAGIWNCDIMGVYIFAHHLTAERIATRIVASIGLAV